jgi:hypothetical protein
MFTLRMGARVLLRPSNADASCALLIVQPVASNEPGEAVNRRPQSKAEEASAVQPLDLLPMSLCITIDFNSVPNIDFSEVHG